MPVPSPPTKLLQAVAADLSLAGITRTPATADPGRPPLWVEPDAGAPAPGDKDGVENDVATVLTLYYSGGLVGQRWERQATVDLFIRVKGTRPMVRAQDLDERIRDRLLGDDEFRVDFLLAPTTAAELRIIEARLWSELTPIDRNPEAYTYKTSYWFQLYRIQP